MNKNFSRDYSYKHEITPPKHIRKSDWFKSLMDKIAIYGGDETLEYSPSGGHSRYLVKTGWIIPKLNLVIWQRDKYK